MPEFQFDVFDEKFVFWALITAAAVLIIAGLRISQKFRSFALLLAVFWLCSAIYNWFVTRSTNFYSRTMATVKDIEWISTSIDAHETLGPTEWIFRGLVINKSQYELITLTIDLTIYHCMDGWAKCVEIAEIESIDVSAAASPGQTAKIEHPISFQIDADNRKWKWIVRTRSVKVDLTK